MPIDPSIPLMARGPQFDPMGDYSRLLGIQAQQQQMRQSQEASSALAEQRRALAEQRQQQTAAQQQQQQTLSAAQQAIVQIKGGNADAVLSQLKPDARAIAEKWLTEREDAKQKRLALARKDIVDSAKLVRSMEYDPTVAEVVFGLHADEYPEAKALWQQIGGDPEKLRQVVDAYATLEDKPGESYTLTPGSVRFDANGRQIASVPTKQEPPRPIAVQTVDERGRPVTRMVVPEAGQSFPQYVKPEKPDGPDTRNPIAVMGPDGQAVFVPPSEAVGRRPANMREQGRAVTSGDAGRIAEFDTSLDDVRVLRDTIGTNGATGVSAQIGASVPAWVTDTTGIGTAAKQKQAVIDRVKQVIGKALEGGVLRKEDEYKYEKILPTIKDTAELVKSKLDGLEAALVQRRTRFIEALGDANYDVSNFGAKPKDTKKADPLGIR